ncbi:MAG: ABC-2 type transport system ATP-binding protein [Saprospiraceae bacterium]|jgi:ABC-2 type transport system ATP-binding protein
MLEIKSLHKSYAEKEVLKDINLTFQPGVISGVVGKNGAGKTTLFRCIAGLEKYLGTIQYSKGELANLTGFLSTNPYYLAKLTGKEYLQLLCNGRDIPLPDLSNANIFDLPLDQYAATYSTGMKKKLALTGVLLQKNEIFILDEPFSGVDIESNLLLQEVLKKLRSLNKIVIISSHVFPVLEEICDNLNYLENGQIKSMAAGKEDFAKIAEEMSGEGVAKRIEGLEL